MSVTAAGAEPRRAGRELVLELVFRPLANTLVPLLERARVAPPAVVLANATAGLLAALVLYRGHLVAAALLLQLKTLLDNADGALARATGQVTLTGRYLDTIADLVVNAAVFAALGHVTGQPVLALAAFIALTLALAVDFNVTMLYRESHGIATVEPESSGSGVERTLALLYRVTFGVLDRVVRGVSTPTLRRSACVRRVRRERPREPRSHDAARRARRLPRPRSPEPVPLARPRLPARARRAARPRGVARPVRLASTRRAT